MWLPGAVASGVTAAIAVVTGVWVASGASLLHARDSHRRAMDGKVYLRSGGRWLTSLWAARGPCGHRPATWAATQAASRYCSFG